MTDLPFAPACERNRQPIAEALQQHISQPARLLEVGSGTGQHGYYFSEQFPELIWQPTDRSENMAAISQWVAAAQRRNFLTPLCLDVNAPGEVGSDYDYVYTANTLHIMSWQEVQALAYLLPTLLRADGLLLVYGPFNYDGQFTSDSNARFDQMLRNSKPHQGIRDFAAVDELAQSVGLTLLDDMMMPANNRFLVWRYQASSV